MAFLHDFPTDAVNDKGKLIEEEDMERGSVSYKVYLFYAKSMGYLVLGTLALFVIFDMFFSISTTFWVAEWSETGLHNEVRSSGPFYNFKLKMKKHSHVYF